MEATKGIWKISKGKGDRLYINCLDSGVTMHPDQINFMNGMGIYGYDNLKDLAIAILLYEKKVQESESILNQVNTFDNPELINQP
jgi:hypothetical protein